MKLYIGGAYQGKLALACRENGLREESACRCESCGREDIFAAPLIAGIHEYVRRFIFTQEDKEYLRERLRRENPQAVILCDEVGCGVVPVDKREREYREYTGRLMTELAEDADEVVQVLCGLGRRIK